MPFRIIYIVLAKRNRDRLNPELYRMNVCTHKKYSDEYKILKR